METRMKPVRTLLAVAALAFASSTWAYQVTGPVVEVTETKIVVQKGKEKWEIARTPDTKVTGDLKVGSKVTIEYSMTAKSVEVKSEKKK
jgi:cytochrome c1